MGLLTVSVHGTFCAIYVYSVIFNVLNVNEDGQGLLNYKGYGGKFKYLTFINLVST